VNHSGMVMILIVLHNVQMAIFIDCLPIKLLKVVTSRGKHSGHRTLFKHFFRIGFFVEVIQEVTLLVSACSNYVGSKRL